MSRKKRGTSEDSGPNNEWMNTYADTITLVLTFFILLYSFSTVDANKFKQLASALQGVLSGQQGKTIMDNTMQNGNVPIVGEEVKQSTKSNNTDTKDMYKQLQDFINKNKLNSTVQIKEDKRGIIVQLSDSILFESGKADIKESSKAVLDKINGLIAQWPNTVEIQGHTDNVPISNGIYKDNFELSGARANSVLQYFISKKLNPGRFYYTAMGEYSPIVLNDTEAHRAMNRRVNILIITKETE